MTGRQVIQFAQQERCSFLTVDQVAIIAADPETRLSMILVRCSGGRFLAPAQDVQHFISIIEREASKVQSAGSDYIRDVSIPTR